MKTIKPLALTDTDRDVLAERIWKTVTVTKGPDHVRGPCWISAGYDNGKGHKKIKWQGMTLYKHRAVYDCVHGAIPEGLVLDHKCRNRACCNPEHLEPVTTLENTARGNGAWMLHPKNRAFLLGRRA